MSVLWGYRGFILASVKREFQLKYRNSLLGVAWSIINPLSMIFIYMVIFSQVMKARLPGVDSTFAYGIYLCAGIIAWFFFSESLNRCIDVFVHNASLIKKLHFPRICLPVIVILSSGLNFIIMLTLFTLFLALTGHFPGWAYLALPLVVFVQIAFTMGFGLFLGILNVFFRDVGQFFSLFLQIWFWLTPIVYSETILPTWVHALLKLNPMYALVKAYHAIFVEQSWPNWFDMLPTMGLAVFCCLLTLHLMRARGEEMVDEL